MERKYTSYGSEFLDMKYQIYEVHIQIRCSCFWNNQSLDAPYGVLVIGQMPFVSAV